MRLLAYYSTKELDQLLAEAFVAGARAHGVDAAAISGEHPDNPVCDVVTLFGVKARQRFDAYRSAGVQTIMLDKGYVRQQVPTAYGKRCRYWRVAVNAHHPTNYLMATALPADRWDSFHLEIQPWRHDGRHILYAGSSAKYHLFNQLTDPTDYAEWVVKSLRSLSKRPVIYRPKPSWKEALPVKGAAFSRAPQRIEQVLDDAFVMVTNGSNACFEAVLNGVPVIVLGDAVAKPISSTDLLAVEEPRLASDVDRRQWFANLAYQQWTIEEFQSGEAWQHIGGLLRAQ